MINIKALKFCQLNAKHYRISKHRYNLDQSELNVSSLWLIKHYDLKCFATFFLDAYDFT